MKTSTMEPQWWFTSPKEKIPEGVFFSGLFKKGLLVDLTIEGGIIKLERCHLHQKLEKVS